MKKIVSTNGVSPVSTPDAAADAAAATYAPIGDYAAIGDCRTIALVSRAGSVDWLCLPHFSGCSWFAALLDRAHGGRFAIGISGPHETERHYVGLTNVLRTRMRGTHGTLELTDCISVCADEHSMRLAPEHELIRAVECVEGEVEIEVHFQPRPDFGRVAARLRERGKLGWHCTHDGEIAILQSEVALRETEPGVLRGRTVLRRGERRHFTFAYCENDIGVLTPLGPAVDHRLQATIRWWGDWCARCHYDGPHREAVLRSALALKLLTYCLSGAVIAAATTSLPEEPTGARNWDYRYCWLRDTSLVLQSFMDLGFYTESESFLAWLLHATRLTQPRLQVVYDIYGETDLRERELAHLEGYRGIGPVRIGNGAHAQLQLDIYGDTIQTAYDFVTRGGELDRYECALLRGFGATVLQMWCMPDASIWEIRTRPRHNTYSKLMCWTALDRLLQLDERIGLAIDRAAYATAKQHIRDDIDRNAFDAQRNAYMGYYGGDAPDASLLLMARYGFLEANDPRMAATCRVIETELGVDGLLYRYPPGPAYDGVGGTENLFGICSFWLVDYLARLGEVERADALFCRLLGLANDVGLYAEEFDARDLTPLGNFPQAFTHVGLITAALSLEQAQHGRRGAAIAQ